jgi:hypothetical protein
MLRLSAVTLLLALAACGGAIATRSAASVRSRYDKIVRGIDRNEKQVQRSLTKLLNEAKTSGGLPSKKELATGLQPLHAGVTEGIVSFSEPGLPRRAYPGLNHLLTALASVSGDMREVVTSWPNTTAVGGQLKLDVEKVDVFSMLVGRNITKQSTAKSY